MIRFDCLKLLASHLKNEPCIVGLGGLVDEWTELYPAHQTMPLNAMGCVVPMALGGGDRIAAPEGCRHRRRRQPPDELGHPGDAG